MKQVPFKLYKNSSSYLDTTGELNLLLSMSDDKDFFDRSVPAILRSPFVVDKLFMLELLTELVLMPRPARGPREDCE
jgi:hypothetical protein